MNATVESEEEPLVVEAKDSEDIEDDIEVEKLEDKEELNADLQNNSGNFDHQPGLTNACLLVWSCLYAFMYLLRGSKRPCHSYCPWDGYAGFVTTSFGDKKVV